MAKHVPAHKPSPADPIAAAVSVIFTLTAAFGLDLDQYLSASELAVLLGSIATLAATIRAVWQRQQAHVLLLLGLVVCACATVPIHTDADTDLVDTASQRLGFAPEYLAELDGAIDVQIVPKRHYHHGEATQRRGCRREVVSTADSAVLAHELGHALGLGHVNDPGNVMTAHAGDDADRLTAAQRRTMAGNLAILRACREGAR